MNLKKLEQKSMNQVKLIFIAPRKDCSIYKRLVNTNLSVNVGKLESTQGWRIEKPKKKYYLLS
jgi:hypothetical protein